MSNFVLTTRTTAQLIAFFNANTAGAQVKKFADRKTAERRVLALTEELETEGFHFNDIDEALTTGTRLELNDEDYGTPDTSSAASDDMANLREEQHTAQVLAPESRLMREYGTEVCPHCGIDLHNGVGEHLQEVNGTSIKHDKFQFACLGCGEEFGPVIPTKKATVNTMGPRPAMVSSLKLDRQILEVTSGKVFRNACQVWKAGLVSAAQGDRLSAVLYGEAKKGNRLMSLPLNGHVFTLAVK
ncbi:MAG: hypothetical protein ACR2IJ_02190 [Fluviibacter sp.]